MKNNLWVEKYRPKSVEDYVFVNEQQKTQVQAWIAEGPASIAFRRSWHR